MNICTRKLQSNGFIDKWHQKMLRKFFAAAPLNLGCSIFCHEHSDPSARFEGPLGHKEC